MRNGRRFVKRGDWANARRAFARATDLKPDCAIAHYNLGRALVAAHHNLGVVLSDLGRLDEALSALERAAALAPEEPAVGRALADTYHNMGAKLARERRWRDAIAKYRNALAFNRHLPEAYNAIGIALARLDQHESALPNVQRSRAPASVVRRSSVQHGRVPGSPRARCRGHRIVPRNAPHAARFERGPQVAGLVATDAGAARSTGAWRHVRRTVSMCCATERWAAEAPST